jgi:hypothetical protein
MKHVACTEGTRSETSPTSNGAMAFVRGELENLGIIFAKYMDALLPLRNFLVHIPQNGRQCRYAATRVGVGGGERDENVSLSGRTNAQFPRKRRK